MCDSNNNLKITTGGGTILTRVGNKRNLLKHIYKHIPENSNTFVDVFTGSGTVALNLKDKNKWEHIFLNDLDEKLIDTFKLIKNIKNTEIIDLYKNKYEPYYSKEFNTMKNNSRLLYKEFCEKNDDIDKIIKNIMDLGSGFSGRTVNNINQVYKFRKNMFNRKKWDNMINSLQNTTILNKDYKIIINRFKNNKEAFMYLDPPYFKTTRNKEIYNHYYINYEELRDLLKNCECKWLLSIDDDKYIRDLFKDFHFEFCDVPNYAGHNKGFYKRRNELFIMNY